MAPVPVPPPAEEEDHHAPQTAKSNPGGTASDTALVGVEAGTVPVEKDPCLEGRWRQRRRDRGLCIVVAGVGREVRRGLVGGGLVLGGEMHGLVVVMDPRLVVV